QNRVTGVVTQITDNSYDDTLPRMEGHNVVWRFENPVNGTWDLALHNMITGITQIISNSSREDTDASIEGDHVVWGIYGPPSNVSHYNIETGVSKTLAFKHVGDHNFY